MSLLQDKAPSCIKKIELEYLAGRVVACDASMVLDCITAMIYSL